MVMGLGGDWIDFGGAGRLVCCGADSIAITGWTGALESDLVGVDSIRSSSEEESSNFNGVIGIERFTGVSLLGWVGVVKCDVGKVESFAAKPGVDLGVEVRVDCLLGVGLLDFFLATREGVEWTIGATKSRVWKHPNITLGIITIETHPKLIQTTPFA